MALEPQKNKEEDWFFDKVEFKRQSWVAIILGVLVILSSFSVFGMVGNVGMGTSGLDNMVNAVVMWIFAILGGIALISLGMKQVPDYSSMVYAIEDYITAKKQQEERKNAIF